MSRVITKALIAQHNLTDDEFKKIVECFCESGLKLEIVR